MLNIVLHGAQCTTEAQAHRGREGEKKMGGQDVNKKKDVIRCEERGGKKLCCQ